MPKATRTISGASQEKYLRELLAAEPGLTHDGAVRLGRLCGKEIAQLRLRLPIPKRGARPAVPVEQPAKETLTPAPTVPAPATPELEPVATVAAAEPPASAPTAAADAGPSEAIESTAPTEVSASAVAPLPAPPPASAPPFDPYAFSLVAVLKKAGREILLARLTEIASAQDLYRLAEVQHVTVAEDIADLDCLREAIIAGTEQRIADRRAAAG